MKKRGLFLLAVIVLLFSQACFADILIEQGWYRNGDSFLANGKVFTVRLSETKEKAILSYGAELDVINLGACVVSEDVKVCLKAFEDGDDLKANLEIYNVRPELKISRKFNATTFFIGEQVKADVSIKNEGSRKASGVVYEDVFPNGIKIIDSDADIVNDSVTRWIGDLDAGEEKNLSYKFIAVKEIDASDKSSAVFEKTTFYSKSQRFKSNSCFAYDSVFNNKNVTIGLSFGFNISLENKIKDDLKIEYLRVFFPDSIKAAGDLEQKQGYWEWDATIGGLKNRTVKSDLLPSQAFRLEFPVKVGVTCNDVFYEKEFSEIFEVQKPLLVFRTNIDDINQTDYEFQKLELDSMQTEDFIVKMQKPDTKLVFSKVNVSAKTNLQFEDGSNNFSYYTEKLDTNNNLEIFRSKLVIPLVADKKTFKINITGTFVTQYGQVFVQHKDYEILVKPVQNIRVTQDFSQTRVEEGDKLNITVSAKNIREIDLKSVKFSDYFVNGNVSIKLNERTIDLDKGQERTVYKYILDVPKVAKKTTMRIETKVEYAEGNVKYGFSKTRGFSVEPKQLDITVQPEVKGDSFTGTPLNIQYVVENKDSEAASSITLFFPLQQEIDILGNENYTISRLSPGEKIVLTDIGRIRAKTSGKLTLKPFLVTYLDEDGNLFNLSSKSTSEDVKQTLLIGPALFASKNTSKTKLGLNEVFKVDLVIENRGNEPANAVVYDLNKTWEFNLLPGRKKTISQSYVADVTGKYEISGAKIKYSSLNQSYATVSNPVSLIVLVPKSEEKPPETKFPLLIFTEQEMKLNPLATLVLIVLIILTSVVAYIYFKESKSYKKPLKYSEKEKKWVRL